MLGVDEGHKAPGFLGFGDHVQRDGRFSRAFRPIDLDDPALWESAYAEREIEGKRTGRDHIDPRMQVLVTEAHDCTLAVSFLDLLHRHVRSEERRVGKECRSGWS